MTWSYRIIGHDDEVGKEGGRPITSGHPSRGDYYFSIHEVFYDDNGNIEGWTAEPIDFGGDTPREIILALIQALNDVTRAPVLLEQGEKLVAQPGPAI